MLDNGDNGDADIGTDADLPPCPNLDRIHLTGTGPGTGPGTHKGRATGPGTGKTGPCKPT